MNELLSLFGNDIDIVISDGLRKKLNKIDFNKFNNITEIEDARSAAFNAFGKSKIENKNVILLIKGDYLSNIYTVCTEAWFQNTNLIVIALYTSIYDVETHYMDRCTVLNLTLFENDLSLFKTKLNNSMVQNGPKIINLVVSKMIETKNDFSKIINTLKTYISSQDYVYLYNDDNKYGLLNCEEISEKYKYGVLSKYLSYTLFNNEIKILVIDDSCFKVDSNIINSRYISDNFKVIIVSNNKDFNISNWIKNNNICYIEGSMDLNKDLKKFYESKKAVVLVIKEVL